MSTIFFRGVHFFSLTWIEYIIKLKCKSYDGGAYGR